MSRVVGMVPVGQRRARPTSRPSCTACGAPLHDGTAIINGRVRTDALICSTCGRLGVGCVCSRLLS